MNAGETHFRGSTNDVIHTSGPVQSEKVKYWYRIVDVENDVPSWALSDILTSFGRTMGNKDIYYYDITLTTSQIKDIRENLKDIDVMAINEVGLHYLVQSLNISTQHVAMHIGR